MAKKSSLGQKYNLKEELLKKNEELQGSNSLLGMTMLTQPGYNNSMRSVMFTGHLRQFVNLIEGDLPKFFTNGENLVGKYSSYYKKAKRNYIVFRRVAKFTGVTDESFVYKLFVYDEDKNQYDVFNRRQSENLTEVFGFDYNNEFIDSLQEGDYIPKGSVLTKSTSYDEDMNYGYGMNIKYMYTLDPRTSEDAAVVSESLAEKMRSVEIEMISVGLNDNDYLCNLYGDERHYKTFPDIGNIIRNGVVCAKRRLYNNQVLADFKDTTLKKINYTSDTVYYKVEGGQIIDIDIYCNNDDIQRTTFNEQILQYLDSQTKYYEEIYDTCREIIESGSKYSHDIEYLYNRSKTILNREYKWKEGDGSFSNIIMNITVRKEAPLSVGQKITGRYGNKSVISAIVSDDKMPFLETGERVDLLINLLGVVNRTTAFPLYENSINFICNRVRERLKTLTSLKEQEDFLFDIIKIFNEKQHKKMKAVYSELSAKEKRGYINDCIECGIYINQDPLWETKPIFYRIKELYEKYGEYLQPYDAFVNTFGRTIKMMYPQYIGEMYILKLKQSSRKGFSVRSTGSVNTKNLPERSNKSKKHQELNSGTPIRFGEFETLNFSIGIIPEDIALFHKLYRTSIQGRKDLSDFLLSDEDEFKIDKSYTSRVAEIFNVLLKSLGVELRFIEDDEVFQERDMEVFNEYFYEGKTYICTEMDFYHILQRDSIRKEVLAEETLMDIAELDKIVEERFQRIQSV